MISWREQDMQVRRRWSATVTGALLSAAILVACLPWSGSGARGAGRSLLVEQRLGAYDPSSKQQELAIIQRALSDEEHGTTPPRVLAEEREEAEQQQLEQKTKAKARAAAAEQKKIEAKALAAAAVPRRVNSSKQTTGVKGIVAVSQVAHGAAASQAPRASATPLAKSSGQEVQQPVQPAPTKAVGSAAQLKQHGEAVPDGDKPWQLKQRQIKSEYSKLISLEQLKTMNKVTRLKDTIMQQVVHVLQEGKDKVARLQSKEKAAETVVKYDKKQEDLKEQLREVQTRAASKAEALQRKLEAVNALAKKYGANPANTLARQNDHSKALAQEHYKGEGASKQKQMRDKVKAAAYAKSDADEDTMEKQLEASLDREVLSMDKHPAVKKAAEILTTKALKSAQATGTAASASAAPKESTAAHDSAAAPRQAVQGDVSGGKKVKAAGANGVKAVVQTSKTTHVKRAVKVGKAEDVHRSPVAAASAASHKRGAEKHAQGAKSKASSRSSSSSTEAWLHDNSPAAQIMKEIVAKDQTSAPITFSNKDAESDASANDASTSSPASSSREDGNDKSKAAAVKDAEVTGEHGKGTWGQELKWAIAHGMPAKLAYDKDKTVQVRSRVSVVGWGWGEVQVVLGRRGSWRARKGRESCCLAEDLRLGCACARSVHADLLVCGLCLNMACWTSR